MPFLRKFLNFIKQLKEEEKSIPHIQTPAQLVSQRLQKIIFIKADKVDAETFFAYRQLNVFGNYFAAAI